MSKYEHEELEAVMELTAHVEECIGCKDHLWFHNTEGGYDETFVMGWPTDIDSVKDVKCKSCDEPGIECNYCSILDTAGLCEHCMKTRVCILCPGRVVAIVWCDSCMDYNCDNHYKRCEVCEYTLCNTCLNDGGFCEGDDHKSSIPGE